MFGPSQTCQDRSQHDWSRAAQPVLAGGRTDDRRYGARRSGQWSDLIPPPIRASESGCAGFATSSGVFWLLLSVGGASGRALRRVQRYRRANERLERRPVDLVAFMEIDGAPHVAVEAGVEEA